MSPWSIQDITSILVVTSYKNNTCSVFALQVHRHAVLVSIDLRLWNWFNAKERRCNVTTREWRWNVILMNGHMSSTYLMKPIYSWCRWFQCFIKLPPSVAQFHTNSCQITRFNIISNISMFDGLMLYLVSISIVSSSIKISLCSLL